MKALRVLLLTVLAVCLLAVTAYGAGVAVRHGSWPLAAHERTGVALAPAAPATPAAPPAVPPAQELEAASTIAEVEDVLAPGDRGEQVRELQSRLHQLAWFPELTTGTYDAATARRRARLPGQARPRGHRPARPADLAPARHDDPDPDRRRAPQRAAPGAGPARRRRPRARTCATCRPGSSQIAWFSGDVTGTYDATTVAAVSGFQAKRRIPVTGEVDQRTLDRLHAMTRDPDQDELRNGARRRSAPPRRRSTRAAPTGRALCIDKSTQHAALGRRRPVRSTYDGALRLRRSCPTREGAFQCTGSRATTSRHLYGTVDAVRDVLLRRPGGALLLRLRGPRLRRRLARVRQRARLRRRRRGSSTRCDVGDKVVVYWS